MKDRLYRSKDSQQCLNALRGTPDFPFEFVNVTAAPVRRAVSKTTAQNRLTSNKHSTKSNVQYQQTNGQQANLGHGQQTGYVHTTPNTGMQQSYGQQHGYGQASQQSNARQHFTQASSSATTMQQTSYGQQPSYGQTIAPVSQQPNGFDTLAQVSF